MMRMVREEDRSHSKRYGGTTGTTTGVTVEGMGDDWIQEHTQARPLDLLGPM